MTAPAGLVVPAYAAAVEVRLGGQSKTGSGLLVGPSHVLTCAHVIADIDPENACVPLRSGFAEPVPSGWEPVQRGASIRVLTGHRRCPHSSWRKAVYCEEDRGDDLALLHLDRPVHGVAVPLIRPDCPPAARHVVFGAQDHRFGCSEIVGGAQMVHYAEGLEGPRAVGHGLGRPAGYSGGPAVAIDGHGRHVLMGLCMVGGLDSALGQNGGIGAITAFLDRVMQGWRALADGAEGRAPAPLPGVAPDIVLDAAATGPVRFRWAGRGSAFRAALPLSAEAGRRLAGEAGRVGAARLPAHLPDAGAARACLARLAEALGASLRLPRLAELNALAEAEAGKAETRLPGEFVTLDAFGGGARLAPPPGTAEWAEDGGETACFLRPHGGEPLARIRGEAGGRAGGAHLRHAIRPFFDPD